MSTKTLIDRIEALPPEKKAAVENFVDHMESVAASNRPDAGPEDPLIERVRARRQRLLREHGLFDSSAILRRLREEGD